jgi:hypothetical protein
VTKRSEGKAWHWYPGLLQMITERFLRVFTQWGTAQAACTAITSTALAAGTCPVLNLTPRRPRSLSSTIYRSAQSGWPPEPGCRRYRLAGNL